MGRVGRAVLAVLAGYLVMAVVVVVATAAAFLFIGVDRAFRLASFHLSALWLVTFFAFSFVAAILGGLVCRRIGGPKAGNVLAVVVFVLGMTILAPAVVMRDASQPLWATLSFPIIGAVGALIGARGR